MIWKRAIYFEFVHVWMSSHQYLKKKRSLSCMAQSAAEMKVKVFRPRFPSELMQSHSAVQNISKVLTVHEHFRLWIRHSRIAVVCREIWGCLLLLGMHFCNECAPKEKERDWITKLQDEAKKKMKWKSRLVNQLISLNKHKDTKFPELNCHMFSLRSPLEGHRAVSERKTFRTNACLGSGRWNVTIGMTFKQLCALMDHIVEDLHIPLILEDCGQERSIEFYEIAEHCIDKEAPGLPSRCQDCTNRVDYLDSLEIGEVLGTPRIVFYDKK